MVPSISIMPLPSGLTLTVRELLILEKTAVTFLAQVIVIEARLLLPVKSPLQLTK